MTKTIEISEDIYERLGRHAQPFETPAQVIQRILDQFESDANKQDEKIPAALSEAKGVARPIVEPLYTGKLEINFHPSDSTAFKAHLLRSKAAWILMTYRDGRRVLKHWTAANFKPTSDVMANLRSGYLRGWKEKGLVRADVAIDRSDLGFDGEDI